jgi:hypothetical protein
MLFQGIVLGEFLVNVYGCKLWLDLYKVLTRRVRWTPTLMVPYTVPTTFYEAYLHQVSGPKVPQLSTVMDSLDV